MNRSVTWICLFLCISTIILLMHAMGIWDAIIGRGYLIYVEAGQMEVKSIDQLNPIIPVETYAVDIESGQYCVLVDVSVIRGYLAFHHYLASGLLVVTAILLLLQNKRNQLSRCRT